MIVAREMFPNAGPKRDSKDAIRQQCYRVVSVELCSVAACRKVFACGKKIPILNGISSMEGCCGGQHGRETRGQHHG